MGLLSYIKSIFALDTIDTRFTNSSSTPYKPLAQDPGVDTPKRDDSLGGIGVKTDHNGRPIAQPSRWKTPEFYLYYLVFLIVIPYMFWVAFDVSRR